jgi:CheY-like chemotaxis protein
MEIRILATRLPPQAVRRLRAALAELETGRGPRGWFRGELLHLEAAEDARAVAAAERFDALLLGIDSQSGAAEYCALQRAAPATPVVLLADATGEELAARLVREGAQDYLCGNAWTAGDLARTIGNAIERARIRNGERLQSLHDPGSGLPNRRGFLIFGVPMVRLAARLGGTLVLARGAPPAAAPEQWRVAMDVFEALDLVAQTAADEIAVLAVARSEEQARRLGAALEAARQEVRVEAAAALSGEGLEEWLAGTAMRK